MLTIARTAVRVRGLGMIRVECDASIPIPVVSRLAVLITSHLGSFLTYFYCRSLLPLGVLGGPQPQGRIPEYNSGCGSDIADYLSIHAHSRGPREFFPASQRMTPWDNSIGQNYVLFSRS